MLTRMLSGCLFLLRHNEEPSLLPPQPQATVIILAINFLSLIRSQSQQPQPLASASSLFYSKVFELVFQESPSTEDPISMQSRKLFPLAVWELPKHKMESNFVQ